MSEKPKIKIITIAVTYNPDTDPDPAGWDWAELTGDWGNGPANIDADIRLLTEGASRLLEAEYGDDLWEHPHTLIAKDGKVVAYVDRRES